MDNRELVINQVEECFLIAEKTLNRTFERPLVIFSKTGRVAGTASMNGNTLNFNQALLNENTDHFVKQTVPREVAHLITGHVFPNTRRRMVMGRIVKGKPHGKEWTTMMRMLGANPSRCHSYDTSSVARKRITFDYRCKGCGGVFAMGPVRHKKQQQQPERRLYYHCPGQPLIWVDADKGPVS